MEVMPSTFVYTVDDKKNLEQLLEAFGSVVSLDAIASAYCKAGRNLSSAGEMLHKQATTSMTPMLASDNERERTISSSSGLSLDSLKEKSQCALPKTKMYTASAGTVSSVIGKQYIRPRPSNKGLSEMNKPLILCSNDIPISEIWDEKGRSDTTACCESVGQDMVEFLFKMLGKGFCLELSVIQDVVGQCGFDLKKSMDKLIDLSVSKLEKSDDIFSASPRKPVENFLDMEFRSREENCTYRDSAGSSNFMAENELQLHQRGNSRRQLEKEVLESLFVAPQRFEKGAEIASPAKGPRAPRTFGKVVVEPPEETTIEGQTIIRRSQVTKMSYEEERESYEDLRKAVKEHWTTMKEYYAAAAEAFAKEDYERANKLLEEGNFFMKKAREADERSAEKILGSRHDDNEEVTIDMHNLDPKEAVRILKVQLISLSGIPTIQYLKVIFGTSSEDTKGTQKRLIMKLLERGSIKWTEEENGRVIVIRIDEINPKNLHFFRK